MTDEDLSSVEKTVSMYGGAFYPYFVDENHKSISVVTEMFPTEAFCRIFSAEYLPSSIDRVLYLDSDIIVNGSLLELYNTRLCISSKKRINKNFLFAAAYDCVALLPKDSDMYKYTMKGQACPTP